MAGLKLMTALGATALATTSFLALPAHADSTCQGTGTLTACANGDTSGGTVTVSSDGANTAPGGVLIVSESSDGSGTVVVQGNSTNAEPADGWVMVSGSSDGGDVSCGMGGEPTADSGCTP